MHEYADGGINRNILECKGVTKKELEIIGKLY